MTIQQVADALGITPQRVYIYCRAGRLGVRVGKHWVITEEDFERFQKIPRLRGVSINQPRKGE